MNASSMAMTAPCAKNGRVEWQASPNKLTRPTLQRGNKTRLRRNALHEFGTYGTVQGGLVATSLDSCVGLTIRSTLDKGVCQTCSGLRSFATRDHRDQQIFLVAQAGDDYSDDMDDHEHQQ